LVVEKVQHTNLLLYRDGPQGGLEGLFLGVKLTDIRIWTLGLKIGKGRGESE